MKSRTCCAAFWKLLCVPAVLVLILGVLLTSRVWAHGEIAGGGQQTFQRVIETKTAKYRLDLMHSPSLPTAGEPANIELKVMRILPEPDPLLGPEIPVGVTPEASLIVADSQEIVAAHLPVHTEGEAGIYGIAEYRFSESGSFLLRLHIRTETGDELTTDFPITVQANAAAFFRLWVNLAVAILILGLTGMQLWKMRARGARLPEMVRPALIGAACLVAAVVVTDRYVLGAVLDLRKPKVAEAATETVSANEDGTYTIPASIQKELGIAVVAARQMPLTQELSVYGTAEARPDLVAEVQALLWGRIEFADKPLAVGDPVKKGQELARVILELSQFERVPMVQKQMDIKGALAAAQERTEAAQLEYQRMQKLVASNPAFEQDLKWAKELYDEANNAYEEIAKQDQGYVGIIKFRDPRRTPVTAPINGIITTVDFTPGQLNLTDEYRRLFTIVDSSQVWVRGEAFLFDVARLRTGQPVSVFPVGSPNRPLRGTLRWIGDTVDPVNRTVPVIVDVPNEQQRLALGSFVKIGFAQKQTGIAVPEQAVVDDGTRKRVYIARDTEKFAAQEVEVGWKQDGWWQVVSGLQAGDLVIAKGAALLGSLRQEEEPAESGHPPRSPQSSSLAPPAP